MLTSIVLPFLCYVYILLFWFYMDILVLLEAHISFGIRMESFCNFIIPAYNFGAFVTKLHRNVPITLAISVRQSACNIIRIGYFHKIGSGEFF
jgi:hypothetical protein